MTNHSNLIKLTILSTSISLLTACGGGSSSSDPVPTDNTTPSSDNTPTTDNGNTTQANTGETIPAPNQVPVIFTVGSNKLYAGNYLTGASTNILTTAENESIRTAVMSDDGRFVAALVHTGGYDYRVAVVHSDGSRQYSHGAFTVYNTLSFQFRWSPDGNKLLIRNNKSAKINDYSGQSSRSFTSDLKTYLPSWTGDSQHLYYKSGSTFEIQDLNGNVVKQLTDVKTGSVERASPNGRYMAYITKTDSALRIYDLQTGTDSFVKNNVGKMSWSPNSDALAFWAEDAGDSQFSLYKTSESQSWSNPLLVSTRLENGYYTPSWSRLGSYIHYQDGRDLFVLDANGNEFFALENFDSFSDIEAHGKSPWNATDTHIAYVNNDRKLEIFKPSDNAFYTPDINAITNQPHVVEYDWSPTSADDLVFARYDNQETRHMLYHTSATGASTQALLSAGVKRAIKTSSVKFTDDGERVIFWLDDSTQTAETTGYYSVKFNVEEPVMLKIAP